MREMMRQGWLTRLALLGGLVLVGGAARAEELPEKTVKWLMDYATASMLDRYTTVSNKVVTIDKSKPDEFLIPIDAAREVVKIAYNTARAQICHLKEREAQNAEALIKHEQKSKKWSDKQLFYIQELQLFVVQISVGTIKITQVGNDKKAQVVTTPDAISKVRPCPDDEAKKLAETIDTYVAEVKD
jgi:hypothetical protein